MVIKISSQHSPPLSEEVLKELLKPHQSPYYFFIFIDKGSSAHKVDLEQIVNEGELLFILPNQIHTPSPKKERIEYIKMSFDQNCLSLLPKQFSFLINPLNSQTISFEEMAKRRVRQLFRILNQLLQQKNNQSEG